MPSPVTAIAPALETWPVIFKSLNTPMPVPVTPEPRPGVIVPVLPTLPVKVLSLTMMADVVPVLVCGNGPV